MKLDFRKQALFVALERAGNIVYLDDLAAATSLSRQFVAKELKRLGFIKRPKPGEYLRPMVGK